MTTELRIAEDITVCNRCGGTIAPGEKYWYCSEGYFAGSANYPVEHTNCEKEDVHRRGDQTRHTITAFNE